MLNIRKILVSIFIIQCGDAADYWDNLTDTRRGGYRVPQFTLVMTPHPRKWLLYRMESNWAYFNKWSLYYDVKFMMEMIHIDTENKHQLAKRYVDFYKGTSGLELGLIGGQVRKHFKHMVGIYRKYSDPNVMQYGEYEGRYRNWFYFNHKSFYNDLTNFAKGLNMVAADYVSIQTMHTRFYDAVERYKTAIKRQRHRMKEVRATNTFAKPPVTKRFRRLNFDDDYTIDYFGHKLYKRKRKSQFGPTTDPTQGKGRDEDLLHFANEPLADIATLRQKWLPQSSGRPKTTPAKKGPVQWPPPPGSDSAYKKGLRQKHFDEIRGGFDPKREGVNVDLDGLF